MKMVDSAKKYISRSHTSNTIAFLAPCGAGRDPTVADVDPSDESGAVCHIFQRVINPLPVEQEGNKNRARGTAVEPAR